MLEELRKLFATYECIDVYHDADDWYIVFATLNQARRAYTSADKTILMGYKLSITLSSTTNAVGFDPISRPRAPAPVPAPLATEGSRHTRRPSVECKERRPRSRSPSEEARRASAPQSLAAASSPHKKSMSTSDLVHHTKRMLIQELAEVFLKDIKTRVVGPCLYDFLNPSLRKLKEAKSSKDRLGVTEEKDVKEEKVAVMTERGREDKSVGKGDEKALGEGSGEERDKDEKSASNVKQEADVLTAVLETKTRADNKTADDAVATKESGKGEFKLADPSVLPISISIAKLPRFKKRKSQIKQDEHERENERDRDRDRERDRDRRDRDSDRRSRYDSDDSRHYRERNGGSRNDRTYDYSDSDSYDDRERERARRGRRTNGHTRSKAKREEPAVAEREEPSSSEEGEISTSDDEANPNAPPPPASPSRSPVQEPPPMLHPPAPPRPPIDKHRKQRQQQRLRDYLSEEDDEDDDHGDFLRELHRQDERDDDDVKETNFIVADDYDDEDDEGGREVSNASQAEDDDLLRVQRSEKLRVKKGRGKRKSSDSESDTRKKKRLKKRSAPTKASRRNIDFTSSEGSGHSESETEPEPGPELMTVDGDSGSEYEYKPRRKGMAAQVKRSRVVLQQQQPVGKKVKVPIEKAPRRKSRAEFGSDSEVDDEHFQTTLKELAQSTGSEAEEEMNGMKREGLVVPKKEEETEEEIPTPELETSDIETPSDIEMKDCDPFELVEDDEDFQYLKMAIEQRAQTLVENGSSGIEDVSSFNRDGHIVRRGGKFCKNRNKKENEKYLITHTNISLSYFSHDRQR